MDKSKIKKVVLAYSGGLDTSIIIPWLKENYNNCEVIAVSGNVGQADELEGLEEKALKTGASKLYVLDLTDDYVDNYIIPTMQAGAVYEEYLLGTSHARPCIAKGLVEIALKENADAICHGCTGKGNDQVRFELAIKHFAPNMPIIAPWREWDIKSRDEEIDYAEAHNVPLKINRETNYSKDKNLWHLSHEGLDLEDPANEPDYDKPGFLEMSVSPFQAPDKPTYVTIDFEAGAPVAFNGEKMKASKIIEKLNEAGGRNGIGLLDIVENRLVGMKDRGVYETPGGTILYAAHRQLEMLTVDKDTLHEKQKLAVDFADLIYNGKWFSPLREALQAFADETYDSLFSDEGHYLLVFYDNGAGGYSWAYAVGTQAKTIMDNEANEILADYIDRYYYDNTITDEEFFSLSFEKTADRIMTVTKSPAAYVMPVVGVVAVLLIAFFWWKAAVKARQKKAEQTAQILNTPVEEMGDPDLEDLEKKYGEDPGGQTTRQQGQTYQDHMKDLENKYRTQSENNQNKGL